MSVDKSMGNLDLKVNPSNGDQPHLNKIFSFFTPKASLNDNQIHVIAFFDKTTFYFKILAGLWHIFSTIFFQCFLS
jgi:hypothetical protein